MQVSKSCKQFAKRLQGNENTITTNETIFSFLQLGLHRSDLTAGEIADEMDKERKYLQLTTTEYLIKLNEIRTKKGVHLLQNLLDYYRAQQRWVTAYIRVLVR